MALEARDGGGGGVDGEGRDEERNAEPSGVYGEQAGALRDRLLGRRYGQDRGQDRPDAGRPAEREGEPHRIGAPQPDRPRHRGSLLAHQYGEAGGAAGAPPPAAPRRSPRRPAPTPPPPPHAAHHARPT